MRPSRQGELQYDGLVSFEKDTEGHITAVRSNMAAFNHLQAEILDTVLTRISQVPTGDLSIPIGSLTGSALLAGRGPRITRADGVGGLVRRPTSATPSPLPASTRPSTRSS